MNLFVVFLCFVRVFSVSSAKLDVMHSWKYIDYEWQSSQQKTDAINSGSYIVSNNIPYDVQAVRDGRVFVTVVRDAGVPATLTTISNKVGEGGPLLKPYPNWSWANRGCDGITGVYRVAVDKKNHLWVLDNGKVANVTVCPAQLLEFDLLTDKLVNKIIIPPNIASNKKGAGLLTTPVVYNANEDDEETSVYMADTEGYGLIVWNGKNLRRLEAPEFMPQQNAEEFTTNGKSFHLADGILGMSITQDEHHDRHPLLFFRPFASFDLYHTKLRSLNSASSSDIKYIKEPSQIQSQSAAQAFSSRGILFYSSITDCQILCWNRHKPFNDKNKVPVDTDTTNLVVASGIKVTQDGTCSHGHDERLWVMTNHYESVVTNSLNLSDINFRILTGSVKSLVKGTNCE